MTITRSFWHIIAGAANLLQECTVIQTSHLLIARLVEVVVRAYCYFFLELNDRWLW